MGAAIVIASVQAHECACGLTTA
ncbi:hypothetical protein CBM2634_B80066 [Cupriavidus taiwanensis]|uniref:Uncharacterized protein n=1 Tax=Cupriavidus taiwanensis TaxID=164546 RepID=A0A375JEN7_9BURK|nr:hypothetical protein CBM2634_B80066 [Cupriavidus taiwanensis]